MIVEKEIRDVVVKVEDSIVRIRGINHDGFIWVSEQWDSLMSYPWSLHIITPTNLTKYKARKYYVNLVKDAVIRPFEIEIIL